MIKKKALAAFLIFIGAMWVCTLISKSVYASKLPLVETQQMQEKYIPHQVEAEGIVVEGGTQAITTIPGVRIETILVEQGDWVKEGDLLFLADLEDLKSLIEEKQRQIEKLQLQIATLEQNKELSKQKKALEEERARDDYDAISRLENTDLGRAQEEYAKAEAALEDFQNDPSIWSMDEETRQAQEKALRDALQQAAYGEADAMRERDGAILNAQRNVEDILFPEGAEDTLSLYYLELEAYKEEMLPYQKLLEAEGKVMAQKEGMVTSLFLEPGERTGDSAAFYLTDDDLPCRFKVVLDQEQKTYIASGDLVKIKLDNGQNVDAQIEHFAESTQFPGSFDALVTLPEKTGIPGLTGQLSCTKQGELFQCCIPVTSLYTDQYRSFVYVLKMREGILGQEYYAEQVTVRVLDSNESWVAIESVRLDEDCQIISYADQEIKKGDVVRWIQ